MRERFFAYHQPSEEEFRQIWDGAKISFDASSLLALYQYSAATKDDFISAVRNIRQRNGLWLTHQATTEFYSNRYSQIDERIGEYRSFMVKLRDTKKGLRPAQHRALLPESQTVLEFDKCCENLLNELEEEKSRLQSSFANDTLLNELEEIFGNCVGESLTDEEMKEVINEGKKRYEQKIPPGYMDHKKPEPQRYGDLIIWRQLIMKALEEQTSMIFITEDMKEDWFLKQSQITIGPRPELLSEFHTKTKGKRIYIYNNLSFLKHLQGAAGVAIRTETESEIQERRNSIPLEDDNISRLVAESALIESQVETVRERLAELAARRVELNPAGFRGINESWQAKYAERKAIEAEIQRLTIVLQRLSKDKTRINEDIGDIAAEFIE